MTESQNLNLGDHSVEYHLVNMFEKLDNLRSENLEEFSNKLPMRMEIRTLEFWKAVTSECLASFIYVFIVCGAASAAGVGASVLIATALASGFAATSLTHSFGHISGAQINPSVTIAMGITKRITMLRTAMFILAQCGGAIAGAAFLYGVTVPGYQGNLSAAVAHSASIAPWERFGVELILTFMVVLSYFVSMDTYRKWMGTSAITIGSTYSACSFVSMPYLNPARSLGPSFVLNKWENHWVYWLGPMLGGVVSGLIYEFIFNPKRMKKIKDSTDVDSSSMRSEEDDDAYDDLDKQTQPKFHGSTYNTYRSTTGGAPGYCTSLTTASLYSAPVAKLERVESLYGGTKSLYCKSPPLTRANLNRSQSVYTKSNSGVNRDIIPKPGPLVPAQSLYPMRLNQQSHVHNQNMQNQLHQRSESIYGVRGVTPGTARENYATTEQRGRTDNYGTAPGYCSSRAEGPKLEGHKFEEGKGRRPESVYGMLGGNPRRMQSDDSSYGSYVGTSSRQSSAAGGSFQGAQGGNFQQPQKSSNQRSEGRQAQNPSSSTSSYHHQHSPNPQY